MAGIGSLNIASLPPPAIIEPLSFEVVFAELLADAARRLNEASIVYDVNAQENNSVALLCEAFAYRELLIRARVNDAARANLLAFARGTDLDHLAYFYDVVRLPGELDDRLQRRVMLTIQGRSTGGTAPRYKAEALAASLRVADVEVYRSGTSPVVHVAIFAADNDGVADAALVDLVRAALNDPAVRMVNDTLVVRSAVFKVVDIVAEIWLLPETPDTLILPPAPGQPSPLEAQLRAAWAAEAGLGFDLVGEWIAGRLMVAGVQKAKVVSPAADEIAAPEEAISIGSVTLINRGRAL